MKYLALCIATLFPLQCDAVCSNLETKLKFNISIEQKERAVQAGGNHGFMDEVTISSKKIQNGFVLTSIELTEGEVASFWLPLYIETDNDFVTTSYVGYSDAIKNFEHLVTFSKGNCIRTQYAK